MDLHGKNVSVLADGPAGGLRLSPAYDLLSTLPYGDRRMALKLDGRDDHLKGSGLSKFAARFNVPERSTERMLEELRDRAAPWLSRLGEIGLSERKTADLGRVMRKRLADLAG